jgi:DNA polymerase-3 subunit alpha
MGKKNAEEMAKQRDRFMSGAAALGHPKARRGEVFDQMEKFAGYGFNKSHSAAYGLVSYQTAYLEDALSGGIHGRAADFGNLEA